MQARGGEVKSLLEWADEMERSARAIEWTSHGTEDVCAQGSRELARLLRKTHADLAEATALLREVERHGLTHHQSGKTWCALATDPQRAKCTCGQWFLVERIEAFTAKQPAPKEQP